MPTAQFFPTSVPAASGITEDQKAGGLSPNASFFLRWEMKWLALEV
jgi:hypothetical protein